MSAGGRCHSNTSLAKLYSDNNDQEDMYNYMAQGYGFATFFYMMAFILAMACAFHISPLTNGYVPAVSFLMLFCQYVGC
jgi:hypothetical protein